MLSIKSLIHDIEQIKNVDDFIKYINNDFFNIKIFFQVKTVKEIYDEKFDLERLLFTLEDNKLISKNNNIIVNEFLVLLFYCFEIIQFKSSIKILLLYLNNTETSYQIKANILFLNINNIKTDYYNHFEDIVSLLDKSTLHHSSKKTLLLYFLIGMKSFNKINNNDLAQSFKSLFIKNKHQHSILKENTLKTIISQIKIDTNYNNIFENLYSKSIQELNNTSKNFNNKIIVNGTIKRIPKRQEFIKKENLNKQHIIRTKNPTVRDTIHMTLDSIHNTLETFNSGMKLANEELNQLLERRKIEHKIELKKLEDELTKRLLKNTLVDKNIIEFSDIHKPKTKKIIYQKQSLNKILLIDLDGTLTNTAHAQFKLMKDGQVETDLKRIPLFEGAKEFVEYQKSINNKVIIVSDSHHQYVEKISHEIFNVASISLCDKPNINKIKELIDNDIELKSKFKQNKEDFLFIGDTWLDIEVGRKLNIPTVLVEFYNTKNIEIRDGIGNRLKHITMGATFYATNFQQLIKIINNPTDNLLALEGIFHNPKIDSSKTIPIKKHTTNNKETQIVALGRQQQGECDKYAVTEQYFNIANENRSQIFIKLLAVGIENYLKSLSYENKKYDIITYVTDKTTTQPKNKMKEIFDTIKTETQHETLFEWSTNVEGSLRDRNNRQDRKKFIEEFLFVKNNINLHEKNIIIIDDQITTGATAEILINQLRQKGAKNIIFIGLFSLISNVASEKKCPKCGKNLIIKIRRSDGNKFFSCVPPKYRGNGCGYMENINNG